MASRYMPHIGMVALASQQYLAVAFIYSAIPVILSGQRRQPGTGRLVWHGLLCLHG